MSEALAQDSWQRACRSGTVWPWPYRFAVISNFPASIASSLLLWPLSFVWPKVPESVEAVLALLLVLILWYWVGLQLDRRWRVKDKSPWFALSSFALLSMGGAFLRIGHVDFLPYGFVLWVSTALSISHFTRVCSGIPRSAPGPFGGERVWHRPRTEGERG